LGGSSSGAAVHVALNVASAARPDSIIIVLLPDTGERYLTKLNKEWFAQHNFNFPE